MPYCVNATINPLCYVNIEFDIEKPKNAGLLGLAQAENYDAVRYPCGFPTSGHTEKKRKRIPDCVQRWSLQFVSENFRALVEELEPGVHEFFPFDLWSGKRGEPAVQPYYVMNILNKLDCIDPEAGVVRKRDQTDRRLEFRRQRTCVG